MNRKTIKALNVYIYCSGALEHCEVCMHGYYANTEKLKSDRTRNRQRLQSPRSLRPSCRSSARLDCIFAVLWEERTSRQLLSSSKLYFLPEDTPQGRNSDHGEVVNLYLPFFFLYYFSSSFIIFPPVMLITGQAWKYCIHFCRRAGSTPFLKG